MDFYNQIDYPGGLGIGLYASFFSLPPGGSSDSEGRAAASPVFAFSLP